MKTSKKLLLLFVSLAISSLISAGISFGLLAFFQINFLKSFILFLTLQFFGKILWNEIYESRNIVSAVRLYASKPFKKYLIPLNCAHCGSKNEIEIDLTDTEFQCTNCNKHNGIHVNFMTAAITEPVDFVES